MCLFYFRHNFAILLPRGSMRLADPVTTTGGPVAFAVTVNPLLCKVIGTHVNKNKKVGNPVPILLLQVGPENRRSKTTSRARWFRSPRYFWSVAARRDVCRRRKARTFHTTIIINRLPLPDVVVGRLAWRANVIAASIHKL